MGHGQINIEQLIKIASKGYRKKYYYMMEDITQEGWVAALGYIDRRESDNLPVTKSGVLGAIKKSLYKFVNLKQFPVTVAINSTTVEAFKNGESNLHDILSVEALEDTLQDLGDTFLREFQGDQDAVHNLVKCCLEGQLQEIIRMRYFEEMSTREVAKVLNTSPSTIVRLEQTALNILYQHV